MAISPIRAVSDTDLTAVHAAAKKFCKRHDIKFDEDTPEDAIEYEIQHRWRPNALRLRKLWKACYCRALNAPTDARTTIAWGYIGISED